MESKSFFNLPEATILKQQEDKAYWGPIQKHNFETRWATIHEQDLNRQSLFDVFAGTLPAIRQKEFLTQEECAKMVEVLKTHQIVCCPLFVRYLNKPKQFLVGGVETLPW